MDYKNETFEGVPVELDGNTYENCTFDNVVFKYSGGDLEMKDCKFVRFSFVFGGALANGLYALLQLFGIEAVLCRLSAASPSLARGRSSSTYRAEVPARGPCQPLAL